MNHWLTLPLRLMFWPLAFASSCSVLLSIPLVNEYASAQEILKDGRTRQRAFPLREWWVTFMCAHLSELS